MVTKTALSCWLAFRFLSGVVNGQRTTRIFTNPFNSWGQDEIFPSTPRVRDFRGISWVIPARANRHVRSGFACQWRNSHAGWSSFSASANQRRSVFRYFAGKWFATLTVRGLDPPRTVRSSTCRNPDSRSGLGPFSHAFCAVQIILWLHPFRNATRGLARAAPQLQPFNKEFLWKSNSCRTLARRAISSPATRWSITKRRTTWWPWVWAPTSPPVSPATWRSPRRKWRSPKSNRRSHSGILKVGAGP